MTKLPDPQDSADDISAIKRREEQKRDAQWDSVERWRAFQQFLFWAEAQATGQRNTPKRCKELERAKLARWSPNELKNGELKND
jgi:hypothetical protein